MKETDIKKFKESLEKELKTLVEELKSVGHKNPRNPADWEADARNVDSEAVEDIDIAEGIAQYESNTAILKQLETQYNEVKKALEKIKRGAYGNCEMCKSEIEVARLEASPSARTCLEHKDSKLE